MNIINLMMEMTPDLNGVEVANSVKLPVPSMRIRAARYYKLWHDLRHLKDIDVIFLIMHEWTSNERRLFDAMTIYRDWQYGADGIENGEEWDYKYVVDAALVAREPRDVSLIYDAVISDLKRFSENPVQSTLQINGIEYSCIGRDKGSAKVLFNILSMGISIDQINYLKQDVLTKGHIGTILMDPDYQNKLAAIPKLGTKVKHFAEFFMVYVADPVLQYAAALLVFEHELTPEIMEKFSDEVVVEVMEMATHLLDVEQATPLTGSNGLESYYHSGNALTAPWSKFPGYQESIFKATISQNDFDCSLSLLMTSFPELIREYAKPEHAFVGSFVMAASISFNVDYGFNMMRDLMHNYQLAAKRKGEIYILGKNTHTPYQLLGLKEARLIVVRSNPDELFSDVKRKDVDVVVYSDPDQLMQSFSGQSSQTAVVFDTVYSETLNLSNVPLMQPVFNSMLNCFGMAKTLIGKIAKNTTDEYHRFLPLTLVFHFIPDFRVGGGYSAHDFIGAMIHHYEFRFLPPVDFVGMDFTIYCTKRDKPLSKQHFKPKHPYEILKSFVFHTLVMRYLILKRILDNRVSWKCLAPMRTFSRYYGLGEKTPRIKVQDLVNYADWGGTYAITDVNSLFAGDAIEHSEILALHNSAGTRKQAKRSQPDKKGRSKHLDQNVNAINAFKNLSPVYGKIVPQVNKPAAAGAPFFFKDMHVARRNDL